MTIVGLSGYARSGKDTVADMFVRRGFRKVAFADPLRALALDLDPIIWPSTDSMMLSELVEQYGWETAKDTFPEVRAYLVKLGQSVRKVDPDVWVRAAMRGIDPDEDVVISDVRQPNEAAAVQGAGGILWRLDRFGVGPALDTYSQPYPMETDLDGWAFNQTISAGTVPDLTAAVDAAFALDFPDRG